MEYLLITQQSQLIDYIASIANKPIVAVDTEFMRRRTLYPELALIQLYDGETIALVDPLSDDIDLSALWTCLQNPNMLKVLHSPSEDIEVFQRYAGFVPSPLFDTQFALQLLGKGSSVGFAAMVKNTLGIEIDKSESRTDWLQRPLTKSQLDYAAADVAYLLPCYLHIAEQLNSETWHNIVLRESELMATKRAFELPDAFLYQDIKSAWQLNSPELAVLKELAIWRRNKAKQKNLALNFVLKEQNMLEIAKRQPHSLNALRSTPYVHAMEVNRSGKEILACISRAQDLPAAQQPAKVQRLIDFTDYKHVAKEIKQGINKAATAHQIGSEVLASKKQVNQLISWHWKYNDEQRSQLLVPDLQSSWRSEFVKAFLPDWLE